MAAGASFTSSVINFGAVAYRLRVSEDNAKVFDLTRFFTNKCEPANTAGAFTCSGTNQIGSSQHLSATGDTALSVTLNSETAVDAERTAFMLTQTGGTGGITFTQSATGQSIKGAMSAIAARNSGGGAIAIDVNGAVTGAGGDGISATNDASGSGITITAASVTGANFSGINVEGQRRQRQGLRSTRRAANTGAFDLQRHQIGSSQHLSATGDTALRR